MIIPYTPNPDLHPVECMICKSSLVAHGKIKSFIKQDFKLTKLSCSNDNHVYEFNVNYDRHSLFFKQEQCLAVISRTRTSIHKVVEDPYYTVFELDYLQTDEKPIYLAEKTFNVSEILEIIKNLNILM